MNRAGLFMIALAVVALISAGARAQGDEACARIEEPLAYNACLAAHGPKARIIAPQSAASSSVPPAATARPVQQPQASRSRRRYRPYFPRRRKRAHAEFRVRKEKDPQSAPGRRNRSAAPKPAE